MKGRSKSKFWWRAILVTISLALARGAWKMRAMQQPVEVKFGPQKIASRLLFERMNVEARQHPYARTIEVSWSQPWPKESGLDLHRSEGLQLNRATHSLSYTADSYGWTYSQVEDSGLTVLAKARLQNDPIKLPASVHTQLRARGWTLTEQYLP